MATGQASERGDVPQLTSEHGFLIAAAVSLVAAVVLAMVDHWTHVEILRGLYSILGGLFAGTFAGWAVRSAETRARRWRHSEIAELRGVLREARARPAQGHVYASARIHDVQREPTGLDPDSIQAARRIMRLLTKDERS